MRLNLFIDTQDGYLLGESLIEIGQSIGQGALLFMGANLSGK